MFFFSSDFWGSSQTSRRHYIRISHRTKLIYDCGYYMTYNIPHSIIKIRFILLKTWIGKLNFFFSIFWLKVGSQFDYNNNSGVLSTTVFSKTYTHRTIFIITKKKKKSCIISIVVCESKYILIMCVVCYVYLCSLLRWAMLEW